MFSFGKSAALEEALSQLYECRSRLEAEIVRRAAAEAKAVEATKRAEAAESSMQSILAQLEKANERTSAVASEIADRVMAAVRPPEIVESDTPLTITPSRRVARRLMSQSDRAFIDGAIRKRKESSQK